MNKRLYTFTRKQKRITQLVPERMVVQKASGLMPATVLAGIMVAAWMLCSHKIKDLWAEGALELEFVLPERAKHSNRPVQMSNMVSKTWL